MRQNLISSSSFDLRKRVICFRLRMRYDEISLISDSSILSSRKLYRVVGFLGHSSVLHFSGTSTCESANHVGPFHQMLCELSLESGSLREAQLAKFSSERTLFQIIRGAVLTISAFRLLTYMFQRLGGEDSQCRTNLRVRPA